MRGQLLQGKAQSAAPPKTLSSTEIGCGSFMNMTDMICYIEQTVNEKDILMPLSRQKLAVTRLSARVPR
jgi:hypothetical protein